MAFRSKSFHVCGVLLAVVCLTTLPIDSFAQETSSSVSDTPHLAHDFIKKHYSIAGKGRIVKTDSGIEIVFSDDFDTRSGPDLKVYLSKLPLSELEDSTVDSNSLKIGVLKSKSGAQSYRLPDGVSVEDYKSVVIHCEAFSKLWGGFDL